MSKPEYSHLVDIPDGQNRALSWAAFGYLNGEELNGVVPTIEGFKILVKDNRITSNFLIEAGLGRVGFDEWLLHEASYPLNAAKQARLEELKEVLRPTISPVRLKDLSDIRTRKDSQRRRQEALAAAKQTSWFNKVSFTLGGVLAFAAIYYFANKNASAPKRVGATDATVKIAG